jgi:dsRNA-specific ribonuclease
MAHYSSRDSDDGDEIMMDVRSKADGFADVGIPTAPPVTDGDMDIHRDGDTFIFDPYNPLNVQISDSEVLGILRRYGVPVKSAKIHNFNLYRRAFIHRSYCRHPLAENVANNVRIASQPAGCLPLSTKSNERLEFLGDGILECVTKYYLYRRFPKANEGFMTEKKIALVKNEAIGKLAYEMGLHRFYIISRHAEEKKTRTNLKKLGCLFEAFVGALFLDVNHIKIDDEDGWFRSIFVTGPGFQVAQVFIENVFERHVDWMRLLEEDDNYKNILQVMVQKAFKVTPLYIEMGWDTEEGYHMGVFLAVGYEAHEVRWEDAERIQGNVSFKGIHRRLEFLDEADDDDSPTMRSRVFIHLADSKHKIQKKAEQMACKIAIERIVDAVVDE